MEQQYKGTTRGGGFDKLLAMIVRSALCDMMIDIDAMKAYQDEKIQRMEKSGKTELQIKRYMSSSSTKIDEAIYNKMTAERFFKSPFFLKMGLNAEYLIRKARENPEKFKEFDQEEQCIGTTLDSHKKAEGEIYDKGKISITNSITH